MFQSEFDCKYFDISPAIHSRSAVFPGDKAYTRAVSMSFSKGDHLELSDIQTTLHIGAHADAPSHYHAQGDSIEKRNLNLYFGSCQVIGVQKGKGERIYPHDVKSPILAPRVLFKTNSFTDPNQWHNDFVSLSSELILDLAQKGVKLVGIDTPSVDPAVDKELPSHGALYKTGMAVLEGILLKEVPEGIYILMALPLKLEGADASPVRAILIEEKK